MAFMANRIPDVDRQNHADSPVKAYRPLIVFIEDILNGRLWYGNCITVGQVQAGYLRLVQEAMDSKG